MRWIESEPNEAGRFVENTLYERILAIKAARVAIECSVLDPKKEINKMLTEIAENEDDRGLYKAVYSAKYSKFIVIGLELVGQKKKRAPGLTWSLARYALDELNTPSVERQADAVKSTETMPATQEDHLGKAALVRVATT